MEGNKLIKRQTGGYVAPSDNTRVSRQVPIKSFKLSSEQIQRIKEAELKKIIRKNQAQIYDADKARHYRNMQNFYNNNVFGYGISGTQTRYDYTTPEGQAAIESNFNYAKGNARDFVGNIAGAGLSGITSKTISKGSKLYTKLVKGPFKTPSTVGKMASIPVEEMTARNQIPNTVPSRYIGYVKDRGTKLPTYVQRKLKILTEQTFPKYVDKLDKAMEKSGFRRVNDPNVQYRAYTNGQVVVDDVAPGNVGLDWLRRPKMIDFNMQTVPEWLSMGFHLKNGGSLQVCR